MVEQRLLVRDVDPQATAAVAGLDRYVRAGDLEPLLLHLVKIRASQINGCAYCLDLHNGEARRDGESQRRLDVLSAWREAAGLFTERERAALAFTEAVTEIGRDGVPDAVWDAVRDCFDEHQTVRLLMAIVTINVWNRLAVTTHQALPDA